MATRREAEEALHCSHGFAPRCGACDGVLAEVVRRALGVERLADGINVPWIEDPFEEAPADALK